jgi:hypothetical protein
MKTLVEPSAFTITKNGRKYSIEANDIEQG